LLLTHRDTLTHTDTHRHSQTLTDTHRHSQTHTDTNTQIHTKTHTDTDRHSHTHTHTHTGTHTDTHTDTHTYREALGFNGKSGEKNHLGNDGLEVRVILKQILNTVSKCVLQAPRSEYSSVVCCYIRGKGCCFRVAE
jgi:hypothetical protein